jgi:hypothetical protein
MIHSKYVRIKTNSNYLTLNAVISAKMVLLISVVLKRYCPCHSFVSGFVEKLIAKFSAVTLQECLKKHVFGDGFFYS